MLSFELPQLFWLLPLPLLCYWMLPATHNRQSSLLVPNTLLNDARASFTTDTNKTSVNRLRLSLLITIWLLCLTAASNPQWLGDPVELPTSGRDLLLAVDISGSMETPDMFLDDQQVNRLQAVKAVVGDFVERRSGDRLGLILFGTNAYLQAPLTFDRVTVNSLLQDAQLGFAGEKTAIGDAIGLAIKRLRDRPQSSRVVILLTDGANTAGAVSPQQAAELAASAKVKIYTIGLGADEMHVPGLLGSQFGARNINPSVDLDESTLTQIAELTGGQYFRARNPQQLQGIYNLLDQLEPSSHDSEVFRPQQALYFWPLAIALLLSVLWLAAKLSTRNLRSPFAKGVSR